MNTIYKQYIRTRAGGLIVVIWKAMKLIYYSIQNTILYNQYIRARARACALIKVILKTIKYFLYSDNMFINEKIYSIHTQ